MYDVIFIGGGPAGENGALRAAELGLKTALIERAELGGTCLNRGCIPTKSLLKSAEILETAAKAAVFGINLTGAEADMTAVYKRKDEVVDKLRDGIAFLLKKGGVDCYFGKACFIDNHTIEIDEGDKKTQIEGKNVVIATGSSAAKLRLEGVEYTLNSDDVLSSPVNGDEIVIIGGGVIGTEFACMLSAFKKRVTIIEMADKILPLLDKDVAAYLGMTLKKSGVKIVTSAAVKRIEKQADSTLTVAAEVKDKEQLFTADAVIVSIGRTANIEGLQLQNAGIKYDKRIIVDDKFMTNVEGIYAVGDVSSAVQLAHIAEAQGDFVAELISGNAEAVRFDVVPSCVYTHPEVASVGDTSSENAVFIGKVPMGGNGRAVIEDAVTGFVKVAFNADGKLIGAAIMCPRATDMIAELALAVANGLTFSDLLRTIHPHPSMSETVRAAVRVAYSAFLKA